jgi:hypothetical protein
VIWIEVLSRHREVAARLRFDRPEVTIGRGYDNDVVLDDPYVAARHLRVFHDPDGRLVAEDLGSVNGLFVDRDGRRQRRVFIDGDRPLRIGHSLLRVREASHAVARERSAAPQMRVMAVVLTAGLAVAVLGIASLSLWLGETGEPRLSRYLTPLLIRVVVIVAWVGIWALLSRVFSGRARFGRNLVIALCGLLALGVYNELANFASFALTWRFATTYAYVALSLILAVICFFHLREIGPGRLKLKGGVVAAVLAVAIGLQTLSQSETFKEVGQQPIVLRLMPPSLRLAPVRDERDFFADIARLKVRLDRDREEALRDDAER